MEIDNNRMIDAFEKKWMGEKDSSICHIIQIYSWAKERSDSSQFCIENASHDWVKSKLMKNRSSYGDTSSWNNFFFAIPNVL